LEHRLHFRGATLLCDCAAQAAGGAGLEKFNRPPALLWNILWNRVDNGNCTDRSR
jgi:hypothetical protein